MRTGGATVGMYRHAGRAAAVRGARGRRATVAIRMRRSTALIALAALAAALSTATAARADDGRAPRSPEVVPLRFAWPDRVEARVTFRRTLATTGAPDRSLSGRWSLFAGRDPDGRIRLRTAGAEWDGDLPFPAGFAGQAIRAQEKVAEIVDADGAFVALDGLDPMRAVLAKIYDLAAVDRGSAERAVVLAEAGMVDEAETLWNLEVGFWAGADLELGEAYELESEGEPPLLRGTRAAQSLEFRVRRRVPCTAQDRAPRCVELTLRATPDPAILRRVGQALLRELEPRGASAPGKLRVVAAEDELFLVTDPATLLPQDLVWTRTIHAAVEGEHPRELEWAERTVYAYRYASPAATSPHRGPRTAAR